MAEDRLAQLFRMQSDLEHRTMGQNWRPFDRFDADGVAAGDGLTEERVEELTHLTGLFCKAMSHETHELEDWTPWKHWSKQLGNKSSIEPWSKEHVLEIRREIIDQLHFWLALALLWGMGPDMIFAMYCDKNRVNHERQDSGDY